MTKFQSSKKECNSILFTLPVGDMNEEGSFFILETPY
jgi:hypothetical protein